MTDLTKGIIEIDGFTIKPGATLQEIQDFFGTKVRVLELSSGPRLKFQKPYYLTGNIYSYAFNFNKKGTLTNFSLIPECPEELKGNPSEVAKYMVKTSKQWLKGLIIEEPSSESNESILYAYKWGYIRSATRDDIHYGLLGGEIDIRYEE